MNKGRILLFALVALFASSCVKDITSEPAVQPEQSVAKKIMNTSDGAVAGELILFVNAETADLWAQADSATRSGIDSLDALAVEYGVESIEPVFNLKINADKKREMNLHRWFVVKFNEEAELDVVAEKFAEIREVSRIEFAVPMARPKVQAVPAPEVASTRAGEMPFNDPMLELQWHYDNQGYKSIYPTAKKGEDINAFAAWKYNTGNRDVVVAVVDEGVKYNHPDLEANMWVNEAEKNGAEGVDDDNNGVVDDIYGYNCIDDNGDISWDVEAWVTVKGETVYDGDAGHGTHVAGTVAAVTNNGIGVAGVAGGDGSGNGVRIMSVQIFDGKDNCNKYQSARGIEYAADNGACILQNSWGYSSTTQWTDLIYESNMSVELDALRYFVNTSGCSAMKGNVAIFAAGNATTPYADYPGGYNEFIAVTAYAPDGLPTTYTNYNLGCNVAAPGGDIWVNSSNRYDWEGCVLSTVPAETYNGVTGSEYGSDYGYMQGTSMACPHVSGIAALAVSYALDNGITLTNTELYDIITSSVREIDSKLTGTKSYGDSAGYFMQLSGYKGGMGTGKLDALMAIMNVRGTICIPVVVGQEFELNTNKIIGNGDISTVKGFDFDMDEETKNRLGIDKFDLFGGKVYFTCKNSGIGVIKYRYIAGGNAVGSGNTTGGKLMEKEIVIVARDANDNGGWM